MRPLTEDEAKVFFEKLSKYIGRNIKLLVERNDEPHCFRLHRNRVYYVKESIMKRAVSSERQKLITLGTCFGKFTKGGKFNLHVTALDYISQYAIYKVWLKSSQELSFLYGNNVIKSGLAKMTECTPQYIGVVVYNLKDIPLGFGVAARSTDDARQLDPTAVVVFHQADIGEYLRSEQDLI